MATITVLPDDRRPLGTALSLTDEEFDRLLDELRIDSSVQPLPADFSRAEIYSDHN